MKKIKTKKQKALSQKINYILQEIKIVQNSCAGNPFNIGSQPAYLIGKDKAKEKLLKLFEKII
jgi:hypothetical protein